MKILKNRKTPKQSKRKVMVMMELFEKYVDEEIKSINISYNTITTPDNEYNVDIKNNKVSKIYPEPFWA